MESHRSLAVLMLLCLIKTCYGGVLFSSLPRTIAVHASPSQGQVLKAGEDRITVRWGLNQTLLAEGSNNASSYKNVKLKLCFSPVSQVDRPGRKTNNDLSKDRTCQFNIVSSPFEQISAASFNSFEYIIEKDVPTATYFIRAYAYNAAGEEVAFGQTTDAKKRTNLFQIQAVNGHDRSLEISSVCFSALSVLSLFGMFLAERNKGKRSPSK